MSQESVVADLAAPQARADGAVPRFAVACHTALEPAAAAWANLERRGLSTPFQSRAWLAPWYARLAATAGATPVVVDVRDARDGTPLLVWPLCLVREAGRVCLTSAGADVSDYAAPLVARSLGALLETVPRARHALRRAIRAALPRADLVRLSRWPGDFAGLAGPLALTRTAWPEGFSSWAVDLPDSVETFRAGLDPSFARELDRKARRLASRGPVRFAEAVSPEERRRVFALLCEQRAARFAERGRDDILSRPAHRAFYADVVLGDSGLARLFSLRVGEEVVATMFCLQSPGALHLLMSTILEGAWKSSSPGLNSIGALIDWSIANGLRCLDFTIGDEAYKAQFGATRRPLHAGMDALSWRGFVPVARVRGKEAARPLVAALPASIAQRVKTLAKAL